MPRGATRPRTPRLAAALLGSAKENEEHGYAAASLRDALAPLCEALTSPPRPELLRFANVQHLGTRVHGTLAAATAPRSRWRRRCTRPPRSAAPRPTSRWS